MDLTFHKYEGLGNDFLIVDRSDWVRLALGVAEARALCDRHRGVGADGVLILEPEKPAVSVINADGSIPEMCGNGIRCAALHLLRAEQRLFLEIEIETASGPHTCIAERDGDTASVSVQMQAPSLDPGDIPLRADAPWVDAMLSVGDETLHLTAVSMGNPHAVTFDAIGQRRRKLGPLVQDDPHFPQGVNVGFATVRDGSAIELHVLERGAGWTQACGTGACAAAVAAVETGRARPGQTLEVILPGGALQITVDAADRPVEMSGPARFVFEGCVPIRPPST